MVNHSVSVLTVNATLTALKFFFQITLDKPEVVTRVCPVTVVRKLPVVLSLEEAKRFMACATHFKLYQVHYNELLLVFLKRNPLYL
jgi:integrase/recombinase XerD